jgi:DNA polymerase III sliding clamp (beta) subunit (PCNA family)
MNVNRRALIGRLEIVAPVFGPAGAPIDTQNIKLWDDLVQVSNGLVRIQTSLPVNLEFRVAVPGAAFIALLKSLKTDEVDLKLGKDGKYLSVMTDKVQGKFNATKVEKIEPIDFTMYKAITDAKQCEDIIAGLAACRHNVSKDENAGALCGVRIDGNKILSTNRSRIFRFALTFDVGYQCTVQTGFIDVAAVHIDKIDAVYYMVDEAFGVSSGDTKIQTKLIDGKYPDLDSYFPDENSTNVKVITYLDNIGESLGRHIEFLSGVDKADKEVLIKFAGDVCEFITRNPSVGEIVEVMKLKDPVDKEITFLINPILLKEFLSRCNHFSYFGDSKLVLFELDGVKHLVQTRE